mgnify:CR=1 FL=1
MGNQIPDDLIRLLRDVDAHMVPAGNKVKLLSGELVRVTQALGGNYTILTNGNMLQISAVNADALGFGSEEKSGEDGAPKGSYEDQIWDQLKTCYDPEIPINIVELGLVYNLDISDLNEGKNVNIKMTLTAPGCGMGDVLSSEVEQKVKAIDGVEKVLVEMVWEPQWDKDMMSEAAQLELGVF